MPGDVAAPVTVVPVRIPCGTHRCAFGPRRGLVGRLSGVIDGLLWPVLTTATSLLPRRLSRLTRPEGNQHTEADPIG